MLKAEGLTIKRGLLLSGPPGDGKSTAIECFVNGVAGEATIIIVEAVDHIAPSTISRRCWRRRW